MSEDEDKMYCGVKPVPKNMIRGTPEYCAKTNQVRYYGIVQINESLLANQQKKGDLTKEKLKMQKLDSDAKILIREIKHQQIILESNATSTMKKNAQKKLDELAIRKDKLLKRMQNQKKVLDKLIADQERKKEAEKKAVVKSTSGSKSSSTSRSKSSKSKSSSGSKSTKSSSKSKSKSTKSKSSGSKKGKVSGSKSTKPTVIKSKTAKAYKPSAKSTKTTKKPATKSTKKPTKKSASKTNTFKRRHGLR